MKCKCALCGHEWKSRVEKPKQCPGCKRYDWRPKKITIRCACEVCSAHRKQLNPELDTADHNG